MSDATITLGIPGPRDDRDGLTIDTPFDAAFVSALKATVPPLYRAWDPEHKQWWTAADYEAEATALCVEAFGAVMVIGREGEPDRLVDAQGEHEQGRLL